MLFDMISNLLDSQISSWSLMAIKSPVARLMALKKLLLIPLSLGFLYTLIYGYLSAYSSRMFQVPSEEPSSCAITSYGDSD